MRTLNVLVCGLAIGVMGASAWGQNAPKPADGTKPVQPGKPGQPGNGERPARPGRDAGWARQTLSPEKAKAAWELEATGVATRLGASAEHIDSVVKAYVDARQTVTTAQDKMREEMRQKARDGAPDGDKNAPPPADGERPRRDGAGGRGGFDPEAMKAIEELNTKEKEKLKKSLLNALNPVQTDRAMASLGTFNRGWDAMVDTVSGFGLEGGKKQEALAAMEDWVVAQGKIRPPGRGQGAGGGGQGADGAERDAMMKAMQESRQKLTDSMKKVLTEDQMKKFEESLPGRGMGGRGQRGGDRREAPADAGGGGEQRF